MLWYLWVSYFVHLYVYICIYDNYKQVNIYVQMDVIHYSLIYLMAG